MLQLKWLLVFVFLFLLIPFAFADIPNLVHHWDFNDGVGSTFAADSVSGSNGTLTNMDVNSDWTVGWLDGALNFNDVPNDYDDYLVCGSTSIDDFGGVNGAVAIAAWVKPSVVGKFNFITKYFGGVYGFSAGNPDASGHLLAIVRDAANNNYFAESLGSIEAGQWSHVVFILESGVGFKFYIDGELDCDESNTNLRLYEYYQTGYIGKDDGSQGFSYSGSIDDIRIYNRVLSANEVKVLYENATYSNFGMKIKSVKEDSGTINIITTGATYVLTSTGMDMYRRIDPDTNEYDNLNHRRGRKVATLTFDPSLGDLTTGLCLENSVIIDSEKLEFEFKSDSFFIITAKDDVDITHTNLISNAPWNVPLTASDRDLDRMWTDGYGGSLLALLSDSTKGTIIPENENENETKVRLSAGKKTAHMVYPPKTFDFESLYGEAARPFVRFLSASDLDDFEYNTNNFRQNLIDNDFGVLVLWNDCYNQGPFPEVLNTSIIWYSMENSDNVKDFIGIAHDYGFKVISYIFRPGSDYWIYPDGHAQGGQLQSSVVTLRLMRDFQEEYDFDGWYVDCPDIGYLLDDYYFTRQLRTDVGSDGILYYHESRDVWEWNSKCWPVEPLPSSSFNGLRAIMIDTYANYTLVGEEVGDIASLDSPSDLFYRYFSSGYGMSQVYGSHKRPTAGFGAMSEEEKRRAMAENFNGCERSWGDSSQNWNNWASWSSWLYYFKPAYDIRKTEYAGSNFDPDVNWPIDSNSDWFRSPDNVNISFTDNNTTAIVTWTTNADSDSNVMWTRNPNIVWWGNPILDDWVPYPNATERPQTNGTKSDATMTTLHSITITGLDPVAVTGALYSFRIRSSNGLSGANEIIWGTVICRNSYSE